MLEFDALREARKAIREFSIRHTVSVVAFRDADWPWFKLEVDDPESTADAVRHRTSAATCLESLTDANGADGATLVTTIATEFARRVLEGSFESWKSDGAAFVYCRVRTLPAIMRLAPAVAAEHAETIASHVDFIWQNVDALSENQAVREVTKKPGEEGTPLSPENAAQVLEHAYPGNAFHTFWALKTLDGCRRLGTESKFVTPFREKAEIARLWTQSMLGAQVAMHAVESDEADPNQLAWALIAQFLDPRCASPLAPGELSREPLFAGALNAFFDQQLDSGKWPLGKPLFHYPRAGNAYCYTFETLAALVQPALYETPQGRLLRELLKPHLEKLLRAWAFAERTAQSLQPEGTAVGWSSGHHPHRTRPESWATASVFSFIQRLRRLLGAYTREAAASEVGVRPSRYLAEGKGAEKLIERGTTWSGPSRWTAGEQVAALFLHPLQARWVPAETIDPDRELIGEDQARSAILFGPPGTSKTTLADALAGAIGWDFVEIHASQFLAGGIDKVPSSADAIFARLMELDRCVVLFDEIDELLRNRQDEDTDPFGRFLTTSMLPKVATLWSQGKIIFFVATNDIAGADPAIKRSQRFDSAIFVAPPSYESKTHELSNRLPAIDFSWITDDAVEDALAHPEKDDPLGYFALLRFDQIDEFVDLLRGSALDEASARNALTEMGERFKKADWQRWDSNRKPIHPFKMFQEMRDNETRDHRKHRLVVVRGLPVDNPAYEIVHRDGQPGEAPGDNYLRLVGSPVRPPAVIATDSGDRRPDSILRYT